MPQAATPDDVKPHFTPTDYQKRFKEGRTRAGASLLAVSEAVGISLQAIGQFELGKQSMKIDNFLKACEFLHLRTDYVLHGTGGMFVEGQRPTPTKRGGRPADRAQAASS